MLFLQREAAGAGGDFRDGLNSQMNKKSFNSFAEASDYARFLAKKGCKHNLRADGSRWTVDFIDADTDDVEDGSHLLRDCKKCSELSALIETGKSIISSLKIEVSNLRSENNTLKASDKLLNSELDRYKEQLSFFQKKIAKQDANIAALQHSLERNRKAVQGLLSK